MSNKTFDAALCVNHQSACMCRRGGGGGTLAISNPIKPFKQVFFTIKRWNLNYFTFEHTTSKILKLFWGGERLIIMIKLHLLSLSETCMFTFVFFYTNWVLLINRYCKMLCLFINTAKLNHFTHWECYNMINAFFVFVRLNR